MKTLKERILESALPIFIEKGFILTTEADLAAAAEVSESELVREFADKDVVFMELIKSMDNKKFDSMDTYEQESGSCWEQIEKFLKLAEYQMEIVNEKSLLPALMEFNMMSWRTKRNQDFIQWRYDLGTNEIYEFFKKGVDRGEFNPSIPLETIVGFFGSLVNGLAVSVQWIGQDKITYKDQLKLLNKVLREMLVVSTR